MSDTHFYWFAPTNGDGEFLGLPEPERKPDLEYITAVAQAAEKANFEGILIPTGIPYLDAWIVGAAIVSKTEQIKPLVAFRPGFISPTVAAKLAATLDQFSKGRLTVNVVSGGSADELGQDGDFLEHDLRYQRTDEFLDLVTKLWKESSPFDFQSNYFQAKNAVLIPRNYQNRSIPIYFGGSSEPAKEVAAKYADVYLQWGEPAEQIAEQIHDVKKRAEKYGRTLEFGVRIHVIVRETEEEAWKAAERLVSKIDPQTKKRLSTYYQRADSVAQRRMNALLTQNDDLRFGKYKWAGIGQIRKGAGTAIVGTPEQVKEGLQEYIDVGVTHFVLSGYPHLEEAERFGQTVLPLFKEKITV